MLAIWISTLGEEPPTGAYPKIDSLNWRGIYGTALPGDVITPNTRSGFISFL